MWKKEDLKENKTAKAVDTDSTLMLGHMLGASSGPDSSSCC